MSRKIIRLQSQNSDCIETSNKNNYISTQDFLEKHPKALYWATVLWLSMGIATYSNGLKNFLGLNKPQRVSQAVAQTEMIEKQPKTLEKKLETVPTFKGYESDKLKIYDNIIVQARNFWNEFYKDEKSYIQPSLSDLKKQLLVETAYGGIPVSDFYKDPMQTEKDFADDVIMNGLNEGLFSKELANKLKNLNLSRAHQSIYTGVGWFIHKSAKYGYNKKEDERFIKSMDYSKGHKKYNGGGDENYQRKIDSLKPKPRKDRSKMLEMNLPTKMREAS